MKEIISLFLLRMMLEKEDNLPLPTRVMRWAAPVVVWLAVVAFSAWCLRFAYTCLVDIFGG